MKPKIRFKGFEGEWKAPSIGEVFELRNGYTPSKAVNAFWEGGTIPWFRMEDIRTNGGILKDAIQHITPLAVKGAGLFEKNSIILATTATIGVHAMLIADSLANQQFTNFRVRKSLSNSYIDNFLYYSFFNIDEWSKKNTNSGGLLSVNMPLLVKQPLYSPCKQEQQAIASYFTSLDSQISASTSRLASLKQMKAASLQAMFPQEGETVPKIRFKGFEGEWKTCVLSSIATMHARIGWQNLRKDEFLSSGDYYLITGTDFHDGKISFETCHYIDKERYDQDKNIQLEIDSILITKDGTLGKVAFVDSLDKPATLNAGIFNVRTKDKEIYPKYLFQYLKAPYLMDYVNKNATGGTIKHLNQNMLVNFPVQYPSYKEQVMIGDYLFNLDRQISLQSQRLEKLKQIKSACLDKMFV